MLIDHTFNGQKFEDTWPSYNAESTQVYMMSQSAVALQFSFLSLELTSTLLNPVEMNWNTESTPRNPHPTVVPDLTNAPLAELKLIIWLKYSLPYL